MSILKTCARLPRRRVAAIATGAAAAVLAATLLIRPEWGSPESGGPGSDGGAQVAVPPEASAAAGNPSAGTRSAASDLEAAIPARYFINVASTADHILEEQARNRERETMVEVARGDTLMGLLRGTGVARREAYHAIEALKGIYIPRDLRPGQTIRVALLHDETDLRPDETPRLAGLRLRASAERDVAVRRTDDDGFRAKVLPRALSRQVAGTSARIESSLYAAAQRNEVPVAVILQMIRRMSFAIDFQRDLRRGDRFEVVYETLAEADGEVVKTGPLLYAALTTRGKTTEMYRYESADGEVGYYDAEGKSVRRLLMRTPVDGARLSSGFGMRHHPILGYSRMHEGVDFAAPRGTPVYAAGSGTIEYAGRNGGYGNYVRIRHNGSYKTAYAHLQRFARGVRRGSRVQQGEVIGYIGSTGASTGPHLHYEVLRDGRQVNPRALDMPSGRKLRTAEIDSFRQARADIDRLRDGLTETRLAHAACGQASQGKAAGC